MFSQMKLSGSQKMIDWSLVIIVNFMWATQVPVIRVIGDRLGPVTVAFIPMIVSTIIFLPLLWIENKRRNVKMYWRWKDVKYFIWPGLIGVVHSSVVAPHGFCVTTLLPLKIE